MNQVALMGRLTHNPELRHTTSGTAVTSFALAVDRGYAPKDGGEREVDFINIVAWRHTGEFVSKYFGKGKMAAITGKLQTRKWEDKDGNKRFAVEVVADRVYFAGNKGKSGDETSSDLDDGSSFGNHEFSELDIDDGELPF